MESAALAGGGVMTAPVWLVAVPLLLALAGEAWMVVIDALMCRRDLWGHPTAGDFSDGHR